MKITILNDNIASGICDASHGLSWFIEAEKNILFDAGPSDIAFKNAAKIGIEPAKADVFVLSHGHWDHGNGFKYLHQGKLIAHPEIHRKRYKKSNKLSIGLDMEQKEFEKRFDVQYSKIPVQIDENIWFLGEIPRKNMWDSGYGDFMLEDGNEDIVPDDTGLAANTKNGLVIISGCAHSGITNIVEQAMQVIPGRPVKAVMGGFHLKPGDKRIESTIDYLKAKKVQQIFPSHCTDPAVICKLSKSLPVKWVKSGNVFHF